MINRSGGLDFNENNKRDSPKYSENLSSPVRGVIWRRLVQSKQNGTRSIRDGIIVEVFQRGCTATKL